MDEKDSALLVGPKIRQRRRECGLTQTELANEVGATASFISHLEHGRTRSSLPVLQRISRALGVPASFFLEPEAEGTTGTQPHAPIVRNGSVRDEALRVRVVRPQTRKLLMDPAVTGVKWELLSPDHQRSMEFFMGVYEPGGEVGIPDPLVHKGEECGFVLEGVLELLIGGSTYVLHPGDSIYFDSSVPHWVRNISPIVARAIWVITPPAF